MCKLHGVRLIKAMKILESMLEKSTVTSNKVSFQHLTALVL